MVEEKATALIAAQGELAALRDRESSWSDEKLRLEAKKAAAGGE